MTLSVEIPPEFEKRLVDEARQLGLAPAEYATRLIQEHLHPHGSAAQTADEFDRTLDEFFMANPEKVAALPEDFSRQDVYAEHD